ncbi:hypothetical protein ACH3VR_02380 [Microbacterium sp. B2969]|uniref:SRPBCC family protein n=1 Tax=Microbacterium alkaliflavum TaxID=3248839 RepID=A0ABW7Q2Z4_9MICO
MATRRFQLTTIVPADPVSAIDFLSDLSRHRGLHAFMKSAEVVATGRDSDGEWREWRVVDRLKFLGIPYTFRYPSRITRTSRRSIRGRVRAAPGCTLEITTTAETVTRGSVVKESAVVTAPWILVGYVTENARVAHARTFSLLPAELASA